MALLSRRLSSAYPWWSLPVAFSTTVSIETWTGKWTGPATAPWPRGSSQLPSAVSYATLLGLAGLALLWAATNLLAVSIVLAGLMIYVGVYSLYLKRHSVYGALIGSLAGAAPPLAGYCAVTGRFDLGAVILLSIFSLWQMPHCYAIAVFRFDDYTAAAIPVLPVKQGTAAAKKHMVGYILAFMAATLMLTVRRLHRLPHLGRGDRVGPVLAVSGLVGLQGSR